MKVFLILIVIIALLPIGVFVLSINQSRSGNDYLRYESISVDITNINQLVELEEHINQEAIKHKFLKHVFDYPSSVKTRYYQQENLKDGVVDITRMETSLIIRANWVDSEYGNFFKQVCSFILHGEFNFSVSDITIGGVKTSRLSKEKILDSGCSV